MYLLQYSIQDPDNPPFNAIMSSFATLAYVCCIFFIGYIFHQNRIQSAVSNDLPWVGVTSWPFSKTWATFSSAWNFQAMLVKAYSKVRANN